MASTRRTTRRTAVVTGQENDLTARGPTMGAAALLGGKKPVVAMASTKVITTRAKVGLTVKANAATNSSVLGASRKRPAFTDVTNGTSKASAGSSILNKGKPVLASKATGSSGVRRSTIRTRSSTGGSVANAPSEEEQIEEQEDEEEEEEDEEHDENAMVLDHESAPLPIAKRQIKPIRKALTSTSGAAATKNVNNNNATSRVLATKSTNATSSRGGVFAKPSIGGTRGVAGKLSAAQRRRKEAEAMMAAAQKELEEAQEEEEKAQRRAKKLKTSEPDLYVDDDDDDDVDEELEDQHLIGVAKDEGWEDLDLGDEDDPLMVTSYVVEVYDYLRELELTTMPDVDYMTNQNEVTWKMRGILIDWLVEIHTKFRLLPETIFLATNIIDRFLSTRVVSLIKFQLVGVTALFVASKYEEVVCPSVSNFLYMTDGGYEDDEILKAERYILRNIDFNLSYPNPINFLRRISKADGYDIQSRTMAKYLMEISIVDHKFMGTPPSLIAAAGNWFARKILGKGAWDANLVHYSGYTEEELKPTAQLMLDYVVRSSSLVQHSAESSHSILSAVPTNEPEHPNFMKKYAAKKFFRASTAVRKWAEDEYAPIEFVNKATRKVERRQIPAIL